MRKGRINPAHRFPLTLCENPTEYYTDFGHRYLRCQAAVMDTQTQAWRQCRRVAEGVFALCKLHSQPDRKHSSMKVRV